MTHKIHMKAKLKLTEEQKTDSIPCFKLTGSEVSETIWSRKRMQLFKMDERLEKRARIVKA